MRGKIIISLLVAVGCLGLINKAAANDINASVETSFMTKYMWHGFETFGSKTGTSIDLNVEFGDTGLYFGAQYLTPNGSGNVNINDFDRSVAIEGSLVDRAKYIYYAGYKFTLLDAETFETNMDFKYQYHDYYRTSSEVLDQQEFSLFAQWKNLIGSGFVPYYQLTYLSDADSGWSMYDAKPDPGGPFLPPLYGNDQNNHIKGWLHKIGLAYDMPTYMPELGIRNVRFLADAVYNDGAWGTSKANADFGGSVGGGSDWTHITYGAETDLDFGFGPLGLGVYYQHALTGDYSNLNHTFYSTLSYKIEF